MAHRSWDSRLPVGAELFLFVYLTPKDRYLECVTVSPSYILVVQSMRAMVKDNAADLSVVTPAAGRADIQASTAGFAAVRTTPMDATYMNV